MEVMRKREYLGQLELMVLLAVLRGGGSAYGASIAREIEEKSNRPVALAGIYAALGRLEAKKLITSTTGEPTPERGGKARIHFAATRSGIKEVRSALATLHKLASGLQEVGSFA